METKVGVSIILLTKQNQILAGKRKGSHGQGLYAIPGGHIEFQETYNEACSRELLEEIGISFDEYIPVGFSEDFFGESGAPCKPQQATKHYTTLYFAVVNLDPSTLNIRNMEPHKNNGWEWFSIDQLPRLFCDSNKQIKNMFIECTYETHSRTGIRVNKVEYILRDEFKNGQNY